MTKKTYKKPECDILITLTAEFICASPSATIEEFNEVTDIEW